MATRKGSAPRSDTSGSCPVYFVQVNKFSPVRYALRFLTFNLSTVFFGKVYRAVKVRKRKKDASSTYLSEPSQLYPLRYIARGMSVTSPSFLHLSNTAV